MVAYYNEIDPHKAAWLRELILRKVVADGEVDERSIADVHAKDVEKFRQCHFFAGIGVWSYALRLAGWPDGRPVWTGSCPCPSFSAAGKGGGFADARHLWPDWARLVRECKPATLFGEQADDAIGHGWLDLVQTDLEREDYAVGKAVLGACSVGAPHIRQRLYFVAHAALKRQSLGHGESGREFQGEALSKELRSGDARSLGHAESERRGADGRMEYPNWRGPQIGRPENDGAFRSGLFGGHGTAKFDAETSQSGHVNGFWRDADWILRKRWNRPDFEWCPAQPGAFPLAHGVANRVLKLRGYGDAIVAPLAAEFIKAFSECRP